MKIELIASSGQIIIASENPGILSSREAILYSGSLVLKSERTQLARKSVSHGIHDEISKAADENDTIQVVYLISGMLCGSRLIPLARFKG